MEYRELYERRGLSTKPCFPTYSIGTTKILDELIEKLGEESPVRKDLLETKEFCLKLKENQ